MQHDDNRNGTESAVEIEIGPQAGSKTELMSNFIPDFN